MYRQDELAALVGRYATEDGLTHTKIPRLNLVRASHPTEPVQTVHEPSLCIVAQGKKEVFLDEQIYPYDPGEYLIVSVDMPKVGQVVEATPEMPYLGFHLSIDSGVLGELLVETGLDSGNGGRSSSGQALAPADPEVLGAAFRLLRLLDTPQDISVVAPLIEREILYRLLKGGHATALRQIALAEGKHLQVGRAISWIKEHYREPYRAEDVAYQARMSPSALHHHFKAMTGMSPLQYQKHLRLQEARRLIMNASVDAATAGFSVGYNSPSQFGREYGRLCGEPPLRDTEKLRTTDLQEARWRARNREPVADSTS